MRAPALRSESAGARIAPGPRGGVAGLAGLLWIPLLALSALTLTLGCNESPATQQLRTDDDGVVQSSTALDASGLPLPTATPPFHLLPPPPDAFAPASLEERIYFSPVIVRVHLIPDSDTYGAESVPSSPGVAPTYKAIHKFRFGVIEYLRGTGAAEIVVTERSANSYLTEEEALRVAEDTLEEEGNKELDRGSEEAILFLEASAASGASGQHSSFQFREWIWEDFQYRINTLNKTWLPSQESPGVGGQSDDSNRYYLTDSAAGSSGASGSAGASSRISLANLRSRVAAAEADLLEGRKIEGYEECMREKFDTDQYLRGAAITGRYNPSVDYISIESGSAWWTEVDRTTYEDYEVVGKDYGQIWLEGTDKAFFFAETEDPDKDYSNGYAQIVATARPLPAGVYRVRIRTQSTIYMPCNFIPGFYAPLAVTVTAPPGTVHEAFFDPVAIGSAIGADGANGALEPAAFTANGTSTTLQSLKWDNTGIITLTLNPNASLTGLALDFIALDGSVALTLLSSAAKSDGAAGTIRWSSATAPWSAGDQLMLRIRNEGAAPPTATPTPTPPPAPTPTPTPTHTPTPTAAPPPGPGVVGQ